MTSLRMDNPGAGDTGRAGDPIAVNPRIDGICAVILAGGLGTRIRDLHPNLPKPMVPVAGRPFLDWVIEYLRAQGVTRTVVSVGHLAEVVERHLAAQAPGDKSISTVRESEPLGTAGAVARARDSSPSAEAWLVVNGDTLVLADLRPVWRAWTAGRLGRGAVVGVRVPDAARYGSIDVGPGDRLVGFREKQPGPAIINAGVYLLADELVAGFPARRPLSMERDVFPMLLGRGADLRVHVCDAPFLDIGTPESLRAGDAFVRRHFPGVSARAVETGA